MKECLTNPGDPRYAPYMDGCLRVLDAKFSANKRNIGIVSGVIVTFIVSKTFQKRAAGGNLLHFHEKNHSFLKYL